VNEIYAGLVGNENYEFLISEESYQKLISQFTVTAEHCYYVKDCNASKSD
jgi:hypothetical protein